MEGDASRPGRRALADRLGVAVRALLLIALLATCSEDRRTTCPLTYVMMDAPGCMEAKTACSVYEECRSDDPNEDCTQDPKPACAERLWREMPECPSLWINGTERKGLEVLKLK